MEIEKLYFNEDKPVRVDFNIYKDDMINKLVEAKDTVSVMALLDKYLLLIDDVLDVYIWERNFDLLESKLEGGCYISVKSLMEVTKSIISSDWFANSNFERQQDTKQALSCMELLYNKGLGDFCGLVSVGYGD